MGWGFARVLWPCTGRLVRIAMGDVGSVVAWGGVVTLGGGPWATLCGPWFSWLVMMEVSWTSASLYFTFSVVPLANLSWMLQMISWAVVRVLSCSEMVGTVLCCG